LAPHQKIAAFIIAIGILGIPVFVSVVSYYNPRNPYIPVYIDEVIESPSDFAQRLIAFDAWLEPGGIGPMQERIHYVDFDDRQGFVIAYQFGAETSGFWGTLFPRYADSNPYPTRLSKRFRLFVPGSNEYSAGLYRVSGKVSYAKQGAYVLVAHSMVGPQ
jgi:hypothetical protein